MHIPACVVLAVLIALPVAAQPQLPPGATAPRPAVPGMPRDDGQAKQKTGTARMSGRVTAADTGAPIRRAIVRALSPDVPEGRAVSTDTDGRWELAALPASRYTLLVSKGGYVNIAYGQRRPFEAGKTLELGEGQSLERLDVSLPRAGVITGTIVDEFGDPVSGVRVTVMRNRFMAGQQRLTAMGPGDQTDDIGQYRLHGLSPGEYYVSASMMGMGGMMFGQSDDRVGYAPTFYPGTASQSQAQRVGVAEGQEVQQINFSLAVTRVATISGSVVTSAGKPLSAGMLTLTASDSGGGMQMGFGIPIRPDGSFTYSNLAPGEYRLQVQHIPDMEQFGIFGARNVRDGVHVAEVASLSLTVTGEDIPGITLTTAPAATAAGRIRFEGDAKPSIAPATISVRGMPAEPRMTTFPSLGRARDDWTFELTGLIDRQRIVVNNPPGWFVKAVTHDGHDITDTGMDFREGQRVEGLEILLTQRVTELAGAVQDASTRPVTDYVVVAFSPDTSKWGFMSRYVRAIRPNQDGRFSIKGLPPDEYLVIALEYLEPGEEGDPEQLERWRPLATGVTLKEGESSTLTLRLSH